MSGEMNTAPRLAEFMEHLKDTLSHGWVFSSPVRSREMDLMILMGPSQLESCTDSTRNRKFRNVKL